MRTIANCVESLLHTQPFLEEALSRGIINYSALAEELKNPIELQLKKSIKTGAIVMALRRYSPPKDALLHQRLKSVLQNLGDITVRSNLIDFTVKNSPTLIEKHVRVLNSVTENPSVFYTFTRGIHESSIIISESEQQKLQLHFKNETIIEVKKQLSGISVSLPTVNTKVTGLYYQIFKQLAWEGIAIYEVISTTNEFTILVEDPIVDQAFSVIKRLGN
ncbi:MAG: hypothetical protein BM564_11845 [Bacteroidetes bacterium MedPE-SWsnd-G2]|nr:MAG: hypothetical protein BM564_11845 [Bacteroidetes bacterium MedPE-SWsnd-G2]